MQLFKSINYKTLLIFKINYLFSIFNILSTFILFLFNIYVFNIFLLKVVIIYNK